MNRLALVVLVTLAACGSGGATPAPPSNGSGAPHAPGAGSGRLTPEQQYLTLCAVCHAKEMQGGAADHAPSLANPTFAATASDDFIRQSIALGRPGTSMGAYSKQLGGPLDDAAIDGLVALIRAKGGNVDRVPLPAQPPRGDTVRGAAVYQKNCQSCHGDTVARGPAIHLANPRFLALASDEFIRYAVVHGRPGTQMVAWDPVLSAQDIDDAVAYIRNFAGKAQPEQSLLPPPTGTEPLVINPGGKSPDFKLNEDKYVPVDQVKAALDAKQRMIIIDARPPSEWRQVHVAGAVSIPYHDMKRLDEVPKDGTWVIAYCACPHHLSGIVMDELRKRGYPHAVVLDEGINEWFRRGYPVVAAPGVKPPPKEAPQPAAPPNAPPVR